ncbi:hypothetical protein M378DRAFT_113407 [Amanita muscaria Koide BX008]|uniref:MIF4G domain-containing protein n=1 Tax=Amanita muscaria (strain Koide BX008) TaxID=946122 RepID=A0A0C2WK27_AMAMK|nr:hypothetical protein M378DRAFT_113407 [Amanita muscaria Koide BX008]
MVVLGRQYNIPNILLLGYATLCQGTTPLSSEEGRRLGVEDVVNIYRIRHELYGSVIIPVSFEEALEKVRISLSNEEQEDEKDLEAERADPDLDDEQGEWTDAGSVAASPKSVAEEIVSSTADTRAGTDASDSDGHAIGSSYADPASQTSPAEKDKETVDSGNTSPGLERPEDQPGLASEQERTDVNTVSLPSETPLDAPLSAERPEAQGYPEYEKERFEEPLPGGEATPDASSSRSGGIPTINPSDVRVPELSGPAGQVFRFLNELTTNNFDPVTDNILQWFKAMQPMPDSQILCQIAQSIVERAIAGQRGQVDNLVRLCKEMVKRLSKVKGPKGKATSGGFLFRDYLGDICHENLKAVAALAVPAGKHTAGDRRLLLIEFIGELAKPSAKMWTLGSIDKWVTALLDPNDEEKVATLCMLMARAGPLWHTSPKKFRTHISRWFQEMSNVAQRTSKPRVRTLLQDVIGRRNLGWVAK